MNFKKSIFSTLLASLTLVSVAACNAPTSQVDLQQPVVEQAQTDIYAAASTGNDYKGLAAKYKLNFNIAKASKNSVGLGIPTNDLSTKAVDLRQFCSPVADQGQLGSCTAFAIVKGVREFLSNKNNAKAATPLSPLFFYYAERDEDGDVTGDNGSTITTGMSVLKNTGVAKEATWPYDISKFAVKPPQAAYDEAGQFKIKAATRLSGLDAIKKELDAGKPVAFGIRVYESFMKSKGGVIPMPQMGEKMLGGHALSVFGYDDAKKTLTVRNSWSAKWGDQGYCYIPYGYFQKGLVMDAWSAQ